MTEPFTKKFSFPFNYDNISEDYSFYKKWFQKHNELIKEVYLVPDDLGIKLFQDMNGYKEKELNLYENIKFLTFLKEHNIKITITFNNIFELKEITPEIISFLNKYKNLIDNIIIPNKTWIKPLKEIKNFFIKNTVINFPDIDNFDLDYYKDYDEIYFHDEIIHNLEKSKLLKEKINKPFGTVVNYIDCCTFCENKVKHYSLIKDKKYNYNTFCPTKIWGPYELLLKRNSIPGFNFSFVKYLEVIDTFKLQGRIKDTGTFENSIKIIENLYAYKKLILSEYKILYNVLSPKQIRGWEEEVLNCGGNCPDCNYCDNILKEIKNGKNGKERRIFL
jgi:hypothetical protein